MTTPQTPTTEIRQDAELDCSGLLCPLPVYRASIALGQLSPGQVLRLVTTDPGSLEDVPALTRQRGDILRGQERHRDSQVFWIEKGPRP